MFAYANVRFVAIATLCHLASTMAIGGIHFLLYNVLPEEGLAGSIAAATLITLAYVPALLAGYIAGRLTKAHGIALGALSVAIGVGILYGVIYRESGSGGLEQHIFAILIAALAGGCGELHALKKAA